MNPAEKDALRQLIAVADRHGTAWFLVGAGARMLFDELHGIPMGRTTQDWDIAVRVRDWADYERLLETLLETGSFRRRPTPHRVEHATGVRIDLLPFGGVEQDGKIVWPQDGHEMNMAGFDECLSVVVTVDVAPDLGIPVVGLAGLALLKIHAYDDRSAHGINKDLHDLDHLLRTHADTVDEDSRDEAAARALLDAELDWEHAGAWMLGVEIARSFSAALVDGARQWAERMADPYAREPSTRTRMQLGDTRSSSASGRSRSGSAPSSSSGPSGWPG